MSQHAIDDYLADMMDEPPADPSKAAAPPAEAPPPDAGQPAAPEAIDAAPQEGTSQRAAAGITAEAAVAAFVSAEGEIGEDEFDALLDALHGTAVPAPAASAEAPQAAPPVQDEGQATAREAAVAAFVSAEGEISDDEFDALLDTLHGSGTGTPSRATALATDHGADAAASEREAAVAAFVSAEGEISDDEFEALLDTLQGAGSAAATPAPARAPAPVPVLGPGTPAAPAPAHDAQAPRAPVQGADPAAASGLPYRPVDPGHPHGGERRRRASDHILAWLRFHLAGQVFAVEVLKVQEVLRMPDILPLRGTDPAMLGVMNLRGQIVPVMDLSQHMGMGVQPSTEATRVVVLEQGGETLGLLVQGVADVINLSDAGIEPLSGPLALRGSEVIRGVARREKDVTILLDAQRLLG